MAELDSTLRTRFAQSKFAAKANFFKSPVFNCAYLNHTCRRMVYHQANWAKSSCVKSWAG